MMNDLATRSCTPRSGPALDRAASEKLLEHLSGWTLDADGKGIHRMFRFQSYYASMAFVNAAAWIAHREDHHPDMQVAYNTVRIALSTHSVGGLSENDFICAAKIDALGTL